MTESGADWSQDVEHNSPIVIDDDDEEEAPPPYKTSISTTYTLKGDGEERPIYRCALPGFEHLYSTQPTQAAVYPLGANGGHGHQQLRSSKKSTPDAAPHGVKRTRCRARSSDHDGDDEDDQPVSARSRPNTLYINDINALMAFYAVRLKELTMKPLRQIVTAWVRELSPKRQTTYGRYHGFTPATAPEGEKSAPWWPRDIPYLEPAHLKLQCRICIQYLPNMHSLCYRSDPLGCRYHARPSRGR